MFVFVHFSIPESLKTQFPVLRLTGAAALQGENWCRRRPDQWLCHLPLGFLKITRFVAFKNPARFF
jgi:hypothetical protein